MTELTTVDFLTIAVAAYAGIVATAALALEVRRWFESGPRLNIHIMPEAAAYNIPGTEGKTYLVANVSNRGNVPTTLTHFALYDYGNWLNRLRSKQIWAVVIPNPAPGGASRNIPALLNVGEIWTGFARHNEELKEKIENGWVYVMIYASHADKPIMKRVHIPAEPPEDSD